MDKPIHIAIALWRREIPWELLLDQIGVDWSIVSDIQSMNDQPPSVIIVNTVLSTSEKEILQSYISTGGAVLYTPSAGQEVQKRAAGKHYRQTIPPDNRKEYRFTDLFDLYQSAFFFDDDALAAVDRVGKGLKAYLGIEIAAFFSDTRIRRKDFFAETFPFPNERVAQLSKNSLRQLVQSFLEYIHRERSIPFVHKWYFPEHHRSLFAFRIDSDKGTQEQIDDIFQLSERYRIPTTWFLDVKSHEQWLPYFRKFSSQEIGVHCYDHAVYRSSGLNSDNFTKAKALLEQTGLQPHGIAAPTGEWSVSVGRAMKEIGFDYSSEFGFDYDNFPSYPLLDGSPSPVVQLPIHPICIGSMLRARMSSDQMITYYKRLIDKKIEEQEPVCLYHHPTHGRNEVFEEVFQYINALAIPKMNFSEYSAWWKRRSRARFHVRYSGAQMTGTSTDDGVTLRVILPDGEESLALFSGQSLQTKSPLPARKNMTMDKISLLRTRTFSVRKAVQNLLDWWIKITE